MNTYFERRDFIKSSLCLSSLFLFSGFKAFDQDLPNVLIIGDSISMGYTPVVTKLLAGKASVARPNENCGPTERGVAKIDQWLGDKKYKVIYFNFGLHDLKHVDAVTKAGSLKPEDPVLATVEQYKKNLEIIVTKLKATGAKLIFATTTPVPENSGAPLREPEMPEKYNTAAKEVMKKENIEVDDLYNFILPLVTKIQIPRNVHYTPAGYELMGNHISEVIQHFI